MIPFNCVLVLATLWGATVFADQDAGFRVTNEKGKAVVKERLAGSSAYSKIQPGDVILSLGGVAVRDDKSVQKAASKRQIGEKAKVVVMRAGQKIIVEITIEDEAKLRAVAEKNAEAERRRWAGEGVRGIDSRASPAELRHQLRMMELEQEERLREQAAQPGGEAQAPQPAVDEAK